MKSRGILKESKKQEEAQSGKATENRMEDRKAGGKLVLALLLCGGIGFLVGIVLVETRSGFAHFAERLAAAAAVGAPYGNLVTATVIGSICLVLLRDSRRIFAAWDGEEETAIETAEQKLSYALMLSSLNMILGFFFFGLGIYTISFSQAGGKILAKFAVVMAGYFYAMLVGVLLEKRTVNLIKEMNPEKRGSVYDFKFEETWMNSCDESEKFQIYQASFAAMKAGIYTCLGLWMFGMFGMLVWDFGILPMLMPLILWLVLILRYQIACIRFSKPKKA